jgi:hypothetical protein
VPHMCPDPAPRAGTGRDEAENDETGNATADGGLKGNGASRLRLFTHRQYTSNPVSRSSLPPVAERWPGASSCPSSAVARHGRHMSPYGAELAGMSAEAAQVACAYGQSPNVAPAFSAPRTSATGTRTAPTPGWHIGMS